MEDIHEITPIVISEFNGKIYSLKGWLSVGCDVIPVINEEIKDIPYIDVDKLKQWVAENSNDWRVEYIEETIRTVYFVESNLKTK